MKDGPLSRHLAEQCFWFPVLVRPVASLSMFSCICISIGKQRWVSGGHSLFHHHESEDFDNYHFLLFCSIMWYSMWDSSPLTRDGTQASCIGSAES